MSTLASNFGAPRKFSGLQVDRSFVKYPNHGGSIGEAWHYVLERDQPVISIIIPTVDADCGGRFQQLMEQIEKQTCQQFELIVIKGDNRQGRAINIGAGIAVGKYLLTLDDDSSLPEKNTLAILFETLECHPDIGIAGGSNVIPANASCFVRRVMEQIPRYSWESVSQITDSDLAQHGCMMMRLDEFKKIGGENELIPRGLDPYLRELFRKKGKRIVLVPGVYYHHLPPETLTKLVARFYRNGWQAAYTYQNYPEWVIETPAGHGPFKPHVSFVVRIFRFPVRLARALITGKFIWFLSELTYATGYMKHVIFEKLLKSHYSKKLF